MCFKYIICITLWKYVHKKRANNLTKNNFFEILNDNSAHRPS